MSNLLSKVLVLIGLKSKTMNMTAAAAALIMAVKYLFGVNVPMEVVIPFFTFLAALMRLVTKEDLLDK